MNREIKFRAYHKKAQEMLFSDIPYQPLKWLEEGQPVEIMQFTGMLDKYKKEVYEDDIVRILYTDWPSQPSEDPRTLHQYLIDIAEVGVVKWNNEDYCYMVEIDGYPSSVLYGRHGYIEVIGNIHETNPQPCTNS